MVRVNEEWWSPTWLGRIIAQVRRLVGAEVTVLRHVQGAPLWVLELESHGAGWAPPAPWTVDLARSIPRRLREAQAEIML